MNEIKAINILRGDNELMLFDALTGDEKTYEQLNDMNKAVYDANLVAIKSLEKQIPKKPKMEGEFLLLAHCPVCKKTIGFKQEYCHRCGNAIDWGEEE